MISLRLSQIAEITAGNLLGSDQTVSSVTTDSRKVLPGALFVALPGARADGHDFVAQALANGAAGVLVSRVTNCPSAVLVTDCLHALGKLAASWRALWQGQMIAVTGSNGKTTVKEMIASILRCEGEVLATQGNLNNEIGLPLTLCGLQEQSFAVVEMGASHPGEIRSLSLIAKPQVAVLNNAGRAHLQGFGSEEAVARAKFEIVQGLPEGGTFVFNRDDRFAPLWQAGFNGRSGLNFGISPSADISSPRDSLRLKWSSQGFQSIFMVRAQGDEYEVSLRLAGAHNRMNALAAIAACRALGVGKASILRGLADMQPVSGRLCPMVGYNNAHLIDDSYNANPDSVAMAIGVLAAAPGRRTLVLGDLAELGETSASLHSGLGLLAREAGIDQLYACGALSANAVAAFGNGARHFNSRDELASALKKEMGIDDFILVKGSRSSGMDLVINQLREVATAC